MQTLLNLHSKGEYGIQRSPNWPYVRDGLKRNLSTVIRYYRRNPTAVKAQHFLVRLLQSITVPQSMPADRYYSNVDASALNISMSLKMTSAIFKGEVFDGVFYGKGNPEILIASDEAFDPLEADKNWRNLCPVKVLQHFRSDLDLNLLDGENNSNESGVAVISINIAMLALQYRAFRLEQIRLTEGTSVPQQTPQQFIRMYVIPNMLFSHLDVALFNRLCKVGNGVETGSTKNTLSFFLPDFGMRVDLIMEQMIQTLKDKDREFAAILQNIPAVTKETMLKVFELPEIAKTRQVSWALFMAQLPVAYFLFQQSSQFNHLNNRREVNEIRRALLAFKSDNTLKSALPSSIYMDAMTLVNVMA